MRFEFSNLKLLSGDCQYFFVSKKSECKEHGQENELNSWLFPEGKKSECKMKRKIGKK
jgi:hypothetical protein